MTRRRKGRGRSAAALKKLRQKFKLGEYSNKNRARKRRKLPGDKKSRAIRRKVRRAYRKGQDWFEKYLDLTEGRQR